MWCPPTRSKSTTYLLLCYPTIGCRPTESFLLLLNHRAYRVRSIPLFAGLAPSSEQTCHHVLSNPLILQQLAASKLTLNRLLIRLRQTAELLQLPLKPRHHCAPGCVSSLNHNLVYRYIEKDRLTSRTNSDSIHATSPFIRGKADKGIKSTGRPI